MNEYELTIETTGNGLRFNQILQAKDIQTAIEVATKRYAIDGNPAEIVAIWKKD